MFAKGRVFLLVGLAISLIFNLLLGLAARNYYIAGKLATVEPTHEHYYSRHNTAYRSGKGRQLVVLFGDSRIAQWNPPPHVEGYDLINRGIDGETTAQMMYRFSADVLALKPNVVVIQAGVNDLVAASLAPGAESRYRENTVTNLTVMVNQAKASGIQVILLTIYPPAELGVLRSIIWPGHIAALVEEANRSLLLLHAPPSVSVVDTLHVLKDASGAWKPNVTEDALHLRTAGYVELNEAIAAVLAQR